MNPIQEALRVFGRNGAYIKRSTKAACTACVQGPTGQSITTCTTCGSLGYIETVNYIPILSVISWSRFEENKVMIGAIVTEGNCALLVSKDDMDSINVDADTFMVDGKHMVIKYTSPYYQDNNVLYLISLVYQDGFD